MSVMSGHYHYMSRVRTRKEKIIDDELGSLDYFKQFFRPGRNQEHP